MTTKETNANFQIRLLLPQEMADQLNVLASSKYLSRLALIRGYLRKAIDADLESLANQLQLKKQQHQTCEKVKSIISKQQQRRDYDNW